MKKWLIVLLFPFSVFAQEFYNPLGMSGCWEIGGELLYWRACTPSFDLGAVRNDTRYLSARSDYDFGFRIFGGYYRENCCTFLQLGWTSFHDTDTEVKPTNPALSKTLLFFPNAPNVTRVTGKLKTRYEKVNLRGGRYLHRGCDIGFYVYGGARYIHLQKKLFASIRDNQLDPVTQKIFQKAEYSAGGVEIGLGTEYQIAGSFGLIAELGVIGALGEQKLYFLRQSEQNEAIIARTPTTFANRTHCVLGVEWRAGFQLSGRLACFLIIGEVGYEIDYYFDPISVVTNSSFQRESQNLGFGGPYAALKLRF